MDKLTTYNEHIDEEDLVFCNDKGHSIGNLREGFNAALKGAGAEFDSDGHRHTLTVCVTPTLPSDCKMPIIFLSMNSLLTVARV
jgi:hypothetical protein